MSANVEDSDSSVRVTRRSMRRMASTESLTESEVHLETPTVAPRNKKLNTISELGGTPKKSLIESPRRTRKVSEEPVAVGSPFRRTTRASSQDKDITASPLPTRASRRSALAESDTDDAVSTPARLGKADRNKRKSTIASPKIAQIVEEQEDDIEKESMDADETAALLDSSNDLELRTRSITKSPSASPPKPSLNGSLNGSKQSNGNLDSSHEEQPEVPMKVFKSRNLQQAKTSINEISFQDSDNEVPPKYYKAAHQSMVLQKTTFENCLERISNSGGKKRPLSGSFETELGADTQKENGDTNASDENLVSLNKTPVRARRSIHDSESTSDDIPKLKATLEDLAKLRESFIAKGSPKSAKKSPAAAEKTPVKATTPQSAKKTPKTSIGESDEVSKLMEDFVDENARAVTPKSAKKLANGTPTRDKTPKSAKKANGTPGKSPKHSNLTVFGSQAMDITTNGQLNDTINKSEPMEVDAEGDAVEVTLNKSGVSHKSSSTGSPKKYTMQGYLHKATEGSKRLSIVSLPNLDSEDEEDSDAEVAVSKPRAKSWGTSVTRPAGGAIDGSAKSASPIVIKGHDQRVKGYSSDEEDGDDEQSENSFVIDEAEVGSEESITESEANYIREHELPDDGESIGSEDTDLEDVDDEEGDGSSFLASENEEDQYSMDSHEEEIEELKATPKRKSRIIAQSSSEDDEPAVEKSKKTSIALSIPASSSDDEEEVEKSPAKAAKSPAKSPKSASKKAVVQPDKEEEEQLNADSPAKPQSTRKSLKSPRPAVETEEPEAEQVDAVKSKKMKRRRESDLDVSVAIKPKRAKMSDTSVVETPDNTTGLAELFEEHADKPVKQKKAKKAQQPEAVDLEKVINKCDEYMSGYTAEKKAKMAIKREKKAQKLAQKQKEAEAAAKLAADGLDSSNNSNKENAIAPKKKNNNNRNKIKKQKLVADTPEEKETLAETVSKAQEKLERKRQRKLEKKLAKQQLAESENATEVEEAPAKVKKSKKSDNVSEPESAPEPVVEKKKSKKSKAVEVQEEPADLLPSKKKKKKENIVEEVEQPAAAPEKKKKKKVVEEEPAPEPVQKGKKRKLEESIEEEAVAQPKKKLNVLKQIENPFQIQPQTRPYRSDDQDQLSIPLMSQKLKKVIPQKVEVQKKSKKKPSGGKKPIPEPLKSLPRPVFTTAGTFTEAPVSPFKFQTTKYVPIAGTASLPASYGVIAFEGKKKKHAQQQQPAADFKTQALYRNMKIRDGSSKNLAGLLRKQHTL